MMPQTTCDKSNVMPTTELEKEVQLASEYEERLRENEREKLAGTAKAAGGKAVSATGFPHFRISADTLKLLASG